MLYRDLFRTLSSYVWFLILPLLIPTGIAIYCEWIIGPETYPQPPSALAFIATICIIVLIALLFRLLGRKNSGSLFRKEALLLVLIVYFLTPAIGALPFFLNGTFSNPVDAFFEGVSGYTTTGASIIQAKEYNEVGEEIPITKTILGKTYVYNGNVAPVIDPITRETLLTGVEALSPALIFWRSFMQWLGGGGIVILFVAILPALGIGGKILYQTEITGQTKESMLPRIKETASRLWKIYLSLTIIEIVLLVLTNYEMPLFDAIVISLSNLSTGGFTPKNESIMAYHNYFTYWIVILFMILGSISFSIYFFCMRGKFSRLKDPELKIFLLIILASSIFATWQLYGQIRDPLLGVPATGENYSFFQALTNGSFQVISAQTSTGFSTANYDIWPFSIQVVMLILFYVGGMAGSTAGGLKVIRVQTFFRIMRNKIETLYRPDTVRQYRVGLTIIDSQTALTTLCLFMVAASLAIIGTFLLVLKGVDPETSLASISSCLNNAGFSFRMAGPTQSFAFLSTSSKLLCSVYMIAGRLEYFVLLIILVPAFWRRT